MLNSEFIKSQEQPFIAYNSIFKNSIKYNTFKEKNILINDQSSRKDFKNHRYSDFQQSIQLE